MRIYYRLMGGHYRCRVFMNGKMGELVVAEKEWDTFKSMFSSPLVEFTPEAEVTRSSG